MLAKSISDVTKAMSNVANITPDRTEEIQLEAFSMLHETVTSGRGAQDILIDTSERLARTLRDVDFARAAEDLLAETLVMTWGALEVLIADVVRCVVNREPSLALQLVSKDPSKKHVRGTVSIETLASYDFSIKDLMGDLLFEEQKLDSLQRMRDIVSVLFPGASALHAALGNVEIYHLWQRRHLIVHRRGVVDDRFIKITGAGNRIGERLKVTPDKVRSAYTLVVSTGTKLLAATRG
jgi:hypothetical protein